MELETLFWQEWMNLLETNALILDRPKDTRHPRYPEMIYPLDYGYVEGTTASDGDGIDVWVGSLSTKMLTGILCTFDTIKRDAEIKLLIGCTMDDITVIRDFYKLMRTLYIPNPLTTQ
jgi:inorganic pyrophosphatase